MPDFERYFAGEPMRVAQAPHVPVREIADVGGQLVPKAKAEMGQAISGIIEKWYEREGNTQFDTQRRLAWEAFNEFERTAYATADEHDAAYKRMVSGLKRLSPKNKSGAREFQGWLDRVSPYLDRRSNEKKIYQIAWNNEIALYENLSSLPQMPDKEEAMKELDALIQGGLDDRIITGSQALATRERFANDINTARANEAIENLKPILINAIKIGGKEEGYTALDDATNQLTKNGILTDVQAAEANKKLGDWMDNYVSGRIKQAKDAERLTTRQSYQELMKSIFTGELIYDAIDQSALKKDDKELWYKYIKGSYQNAPTETAYDGHKAMFNAVYDAATLQVSPKEAYDVLLQTRFTDREITDEQFQWAVDKIENPYPKHMIEDINVIWRSNLVDFNRWFSADTKRNMKVNGSLLAWIDNQIKEGKFPTRKEMYAISSQFRVGDTGYDIGQVIKRGDREWEIVGFDKDGEPLVEEVQ